MSDSISVRFIEPSYLILRVDDDPVGAIARAARTCYRSEGCASPENDERLVRSLIANGHTAMLEHAGMSVRFVTDRAIANEIVRHRLFSFAQESTRYVNAGNGGYEFILPYGRNGSEDAAIRTACKHAAGAYHALVENGTKPEMARALLPLCTATSIVVTGNMREWRHFFSLRTERHAHRDMRRIASPLLTEMKERLPVLFGDMEPHEEDFS